MKKFVSWLEFSKMSLEEWLEVTKDVVTMCQCSDGITIFKGEKNDEM